MEDSDEALARLLQAQENEQWDPSVMGFSPPAASTNGTMSIVDPTWETIDPTPDVLAMFLEFNRKYFWGKLDGCEVRWSPRMTSCAGLCCYEGFGGLCSIRLSEPLLKLRPRKDLVETLLHEMIHAFLFVTANNKDHDAHGPEFHKHMYRLNKETGTNITVYHNFHDEVNNYKTHVWQCDGPCRKQPPYFGILKRAMNRAPSPRDFWWAEHQSKCGGTYVKVKEPEGYGQKKIKPKEKKSPEKPKGVPDIRTMLGGGLNVKNGVLKKVPTSNNTGNNSSVIHQGKTNKPTMKTNVKGNNVSNANNNNNNSNVKKDSKTTIVGGILSRQTKSHTDIINDMKSIVESTGTHKNTPNVRSLFPPVKTSVSSTGVGSLSDETKSKGNLFRDTGNKPNGTIGPNIHTISSAPVCRDVSEFSGAGYKLGGTITKPLPGGSLPMKPHTIVRRIPGIGLIKTERPCSSDSDTKSEASSSCTTEPKNESVRTTPTESDSESDGAKSRNRTRSPSVESKTQPIDRKPVVENISPRRNQRKKTLSFKAATGNQAYLTSDDNDEDILFDLSNSKIKVSDIPDSPAAKKHRLSHPSVGRRSISPKSRRIFGPENKIIASKNRKNGVKSQSMINLSANRNTRALALDTSDDDTGDEEKTSIGSVLKKKLKVPIIDSDDDYEITSINSDSESMKTLISSGTDGRISTDSETSVKAISPGAVHLDLDVTQFSAHHRKPKYGVLVKPVAGKPGSSLTSGTDFTSPLKRSLTNSGLDSSANSPASKRSRLISTETGSGKSSHNNNTRGNLLSGMSAQSSTTGSGAHESAFNSFTQSIPLVSDVLRECPVCNGKYPESGMNDHLDECLPDL